MNTIVTTDPEFVPVAERGAFDRFFLKYIINEKDLPFVYLTIKMLCTQIPLAIFLFIPGCSRTIYIDVAQY
jgi:hypothetical protein